MRRKSFLIAWILITLIASVFCAIPIANLEYTMATSTTILVPDNYATIQGALNASKNGDIIQVKAKVYYEHVVVNKSVSLVGEHSDTTIIDGNGTGTIILVTADNVVVSGFTVRKGDYGIRVVSSANCTIREIEAKSNFDGIDVLSSHNIVVMRNNASYNKKRGIYLESSWDSKVIENTANNNREGFGYGINLYKSWNCSVSGNVANNNYYDGLGFLESRNCLASENTAHGTNFMGIWIDDSQNLTFLANDVSKNFPGVSLISSKNCTFERNNIHNNQGSGVQIDNTNITLFHHNNIINNTKQVKMDESTPIRKSFYNVWDDGYPSGGNYWSDYNGTDLHSGLYQNETGSDRIGDTHYIIDANNQDHYPLMYPLLRPIANFTYLPSGPLVSETITFNASGSYDPDGSIISYKWDFGDGNITSVTTPIINHTYTTLGTYNTVLTVLDNHEFTDSITRTIQVKTQETNMMPYIAAIAILVFVGLAISLYLLKIRKKTS